MDAQVRLDDETSRAVDGLVEAGRFETPEAVVREGVRLVREQEYRDRIEELVRPALDAIDRGEGIPAEVAFAQLRARYQEMVVERRS